MNESPERLTLRAMTMQDIRKVAQLEASCFSQPWSPEAFRRELEDTRTAYYTVLRDGRRLVGYLGARIIVPEAHLTTIAVLPEYRGRGFAKCLLLDLLDFGLARGVQQLTLEVRESNWPARKLYESLGFIEVAFRKRYYGNPTEDAVIMWIHDLHAPAVQAAVAAVRATVPVFPAKLADATEPAGPRGLLSRLFRGGQQ